MSECVVRMEMPKACWSCGLRFVCKAANDFMTTKEAGCSALVVGMEGCLISCQLPEGHGRLVDADAFEKDVSDALVYGLKEIPSEEGKQIFHVLMQEVLDNVKKRKTIVPAERSEK